MLARRARARSVGLYWPLAASFAIAVLFLYTYRTFLSEYLVPASRRPSSQTSIDLNSDGVPDLCDNGTGPTAQCLIDGVWTAVPRPTSRPDGPERPTTSSNVPALPTGTLPSPEKFKKQNGTKWMIEYMGNISFIGELADKNLVGDKCRSSVLGDKIIWNCGDMWCDFDYTICGFAMGPALYGTDDVMTINATGVTHIYKNDFLKPWSGDPEPELPSKFWGMDTSNVAAINDTHGVVYGFEVWRGTGVDVRRGNAVAWVTLGEDMPIATRVGPLLTGPNAIEMGILAILRDGGYIYIYSAGGPSRLIVTRVLASAYAIFDASQYQSLEYGSDNVWSNTIPSANTTQYGMTTKQKNSKFSCLNYGSIFYSNYFNKYIIICNIYMVATNMYVSDTPWGPWSSEYGLLRGWRGYGSMVHPWASSGEGGAIGGSHREVWFSQGPNTGFHMFRVDFSGYDT